MTPHQYRWGLAAMDFIYTLPDIWKTHQINTVRHNLSYGKPITFSSMKYPTKRKPTISLP